MSGKIITSAWTLAVIATALALAGAQQTRVAVVAGGSVAESVTARDFKLVEPFACGMDNHGTRYIVEMAGRLLAVDRSGGIRRVAGGNEPGASGDFGPAADARLSAPHHLLVLPSGDVLVADTQNHRVRRLEMHTGSILPFAGTGASGFAGDGGPALEAKFGAVYCLALDAKRHALYVDDLDNRRIRRIDTITGVVTTVAGNGRQGIPADGAIAADAPLVDPRAIACDSKGVLYILERSGNVLRAVDSHGRIWTVAGTGRAGPAADGEARSATLRGPKHVTVDSHDNVLIADTDNHVVRRFLAREGRIVTVAGTGVAGSGLGDGSPLTVQLNQPHGVYVAPDRSLYICDSWNGRVLRVREK